MYNRIFKPLFDFFISLLLLIISSPIIIVIVLLLLIATNGTPFFVQTRPGKNEKLFKLLKFKTMNERKDTSGNLLPDDKRLTAIGKIIRKLSLDELPQLINALKGDLSLIGPRPLLVEYLPLYNKEQKRRHEVKPGITGWAQINGRNTISWEEKFKLDIWYVDNISFKLDVKVFFLTILKVFRIEGISSETSVTMEKFKGNN